MSNDTEPPSQHIPKMIIVEYERLMRRDLDGHLFNESQREAITRILLSLAIAIATVSRIPVVKLSANHAGIGLIIIGMFGALLSLKHSERSAFHLHRYRALRDELHGEFDDERLRRFSRFSENRNWPLSWFASLRLYILWPLVFFLVASVGFAFVFIGDG